jgi:uncharacterized protein
LNVRRFQSVDDFYSRAETFLVGHEAEHNLSLGICAALRFTPDRYPDPYLALVEDGGKVVATALMTPPHNVVLSVSATPETSELFAADLYQSHWKPPSVAGPTQLSEAFAQHWQSLTKQTYKTKMSMRIYQLDEVKPPQDVSGSMRRAEKKDRDRCIEWAIAFDEEALGRSQPDEAAEWVDFFLASDPAVRGLMVWDNGGPVSMACYVGPTPHGMRIGRVYTPPALRGKGYASACVAAVSQLILDTGRRFCFLFTDLNNPTSNHIYQDIGYNPVSDVTEFAFTDPQSK